ncbi:unnamed protein product [[Candida] boidinii]|uniref:Unnamed protein product n=1 Tax=Candida boidinii TaxID=5477 RepID=A0A9W6T718_CANBO|nr:unnamed protein product [[Candida] boidinii]
MSSTTTTTTTTAHSGSTQPDLERGNLMNLLISVISDKILEKYHSSKVTTTAGASISTIANDELINLKQDLICFIRLLLSRSGLSLKNFEKSVLYLNRFNHLIKNEIKNTIELKLIIVYSFILSSNSISNPLSGGDTSSNDIKNWSVITGLKPNLLINGYNKFYQSLNESNLIYINQNDLSNLNNSLKLEIRKLIKFL